MIDSEPMVWGERAPRKYLDGSFDSHDKLNDSWDDDWYDNGPTNYRDDCDYHFYYDD
jgi:hypothetical protein